MTKNTIVSLIIIFVFVGSVVWWSKSVSVEDKELSAFEPGGSHPAKVAGVTTDQLTALETFYDFGTISMKNGKVSKVFKLTNSTDGDIKVPSVTTSCMCTTAYILRDGERSRPFGMPGHGGAVPKANAVVASGESLDIEVEYDPNAHGPAGVGLIERAVFVEDENDNVVELNFKVNVTP